MIDKPFDINEASIKKYVETLRPEDPAIREQLDIGYSYDGKVAILYEIRPKWNDPNKIQHLEFAKIRYYKSKKRMASVLETRQWKMGTL